jgi:hypothetical protein
MHSLTSQRGHVIAPVALVVALSVSACARQLEGVEAATQPVIDEEARASLAPTGSVFTVFNHGTDFHRDKDPNELITRLSESALGSEARIVLTGPPSPRDPLPYRLASPDPGYVICEGPGSEAVSAEDSRSGVAHAFPGRDNPILGGEKATSESLDLNPALSPAGRRRYWILGARQTSAFQDSFMGQTPEAHQLTGRAFGNGWDDNIYKVVWLVQHLKFGEDRQIDTVNIVGWSRGAVTSLKMANKLFEVFEDTIRVNIVAIDPVPGGFTRETLDTKVIPPNVRDYLAVLALDDDRSNFQPLDRAKVRLMAPRSQHGSGGNPESRNPMHLVTRVHFLPMPGNHSDLVNSDLSSPAVRGSAELTERIARQFLLAHGTGMKAAPDSDRGRVCRAYAELSLHREEIAASASGGWVDAVGGYRLERGVRAHRSAYVEESAAYLNAHHRALCGGAPACAGRERAYTTAAWTGWNEPGTLELSRQQGCVMPMLDPSGGP